MGLAEDASVAWGLPFTGAIRQTALSSTPNLVPDLPGVYGLLLEDAGQLVDGLNPLEFYPEGLACFQGWTLAYIGASRESLRRRMLLHATNGGPGSSVTETVRAGLIHAHVIDATDSKATRRWLDGRACYLYYVTDTDTDAFVEEHQALCTHVTLLNIAPIRKRPYAMKLIRLRREAQEATHHLSRRAAPPPMCKAHPFRSESPVTRL